MAREYQLKKIGSVISSSTDYRAELNDQQYEAVTSGPGPALVLAGAGKKIGVNRVACGVKSLLVHLIVCADDDRDFFRGHDRIFAAVSRCAEFARRRGLYCEYCSDRSASAAD